MPPRKRSTDVEEYESDGGFIEDAPRSKKAKTSKTAINEVKKREGKKEIQLGMQKDDEGNPFWEVRCMAHPVIAWNSPLTVTPSRSPRRGESKYRSSRARVW